VFANGTAAEWRKRESKSERRIGMPKRQAIVAPMVDDIGEQGSVVSLRQEVKEALREVLRSKDASAAAKASAGRTLLEYFDDSESSHASARRGADMTIAELDHAIALSEKG
jgi:hypothetical protein